MMFDPEWNNEQSKVLTSHFKGKLADNRETIDTIVTAFLIGQVNTQDDLVVESELCSSNEILDGEEADAVVPVDEPFLLDEEEHGARFKAYLQET